MGLAAFKKEVAAAQGYGSFFVCVSADLFYLVQGCARGYKVEGASLCPFQVFPAECQAEAVYADNSQAVFPISKRDPVWMGRDSSVETAKDVSEIMERRVFCWMRMEYWSSTSGSSG